MDVYRAFHETNLQIRAQAGNVWIVTVDNCFPFNIPCSAPSGVIRPTGNWAVKIPNINQQFFVYDIEIRDRD